MKNIFQVISFVAVFFVGLANAAAPTNTKGEGSAIHGYDPVAYFTESKAVKGDDQFSADYNGATWLFAKAENKALFEADPEKYAPQYGGYCAYAAANDAVVDVDPTAWHISDGKLFLNYNQRIQKKWLAEKSSYISKADAFWMTLK